MNRKHTPQTAVAAVLADPVLPPGDDERFVGFGIMGMPFANGHYLAMRQFAATSFGTPYVSVWHRDPSCNWTFYATTPGEQSCARYFSSATTTDAIQCDIDVRWNGPWTVHIEIPEILQWTVEFESTRASRVMSAIGQRLTESTWSDPSRLRRLSAVARRTLGVGDVRLTGRAPNGQCYMMAPKQVWLAADSHAVLNGRDLGISGSLMRQARLGGFLMPQRGVGMVGSGHFESFDPDRHVVPARPAVFA